MTDISRHVSLLYVSIFSVGLLHWVHHADLRKVTTELRNHHSCNAGDTRCRPDIMERGRLWGEVYLYREGPTSGGRVRKQQQDTSWEILTQKPRPETLPQFCRGTQWGRPSLFVCYLNCPRKWSFMELLLSCFKSREMMQKTKSLIYLSGM